MTPPHGTPPTARQPSLVDHLTSFGGDTQQDEQPHDVLYVLGDAASALSQSVADRELRNADLGPLDGVSGGLRGDRFDPTEVGLPAHPTLKECAERLILATAALTHRNRARLRRHAVMTVLVNSTAPERLRAATRWLQAVTGVGDNMSARNLLLAVYEREQQAAMHAVMEIGGAPLAHNEAKKWAHPNASTEYHDLVQTSYEGFISTLLRYDHLLGKVSTYSYFSIQENLSRLVRKQEHPGMSRMTFSRKSQIIATAAKIVGDDTDVDVLSDEVLQQIANKFEGVNADGVRKVLCGSRNVPLNALASGRGIEDSDADEYGQLLADNQPTPEDRVLYDETIEAVGRVGQQLLTEQEIDILRRYEGIGYEEHDLATIAKLHGKSRTWAGGRRNRALAKFQTPTALAEIVGIESDPSRLRSRIGAGVGHVWLDVLTEKQRFVARNLFGIGSTPMGGAFDVKVEHIAGQMKQTVRAVKEIAREVLVANPAWTDEQSLVAGNVLWGSPEGTDSMRQRVKQAIAEHGMTAAGIAAMVPQMLAAVPADAAHMLVTDPWSDRLSTRQQAVASVLFGVGGVARTGSRDEVMTSLCSGTGMTHGQIVFLARTVLRTNPGWTEVEQVVADEMLWGRHLSGVTMSQRYRTAGEKTGLDGFAVRATVTRMLSEAPRFAADMVVSVTKQDWP